MKRSTTGFESSSDRWSSANAGSWIESVYPSNRGIVGTSTDSEPLSRAAIAQNSSSFMMNDTCLSSFPDF